jgi:hypothetical protein
LALDGNSSQQPDREVDADSAARKRTLRVRVNFSKICFIAMRAPRFRAINLLAWLFELMVRLHAHSLTHAGWLYGV